MLLFSVVQLGRFASLLLRGYFGKLEPRERGEAGGPAETAVLGRDNAGGEDDVSQGKRNGRWYGAMLIAPS